MSLLDEQHGSITRYRKGCQCEQCLEAPMRRADKRRRASIQGIPRKDLFLCGLCGREFASKQSRGSHEARCEW